MLTARSKVAVASNPHSATQEARGGRAVSVRKSYKYKLKPTLDQERMLDETLWRCRDLYNTGLAQRIWAHRHGGVTITHA
jgi:hypothetical protein